MATRRLVLAGMLASAVPRVGWADAGSPAWLAAARLPDDSHALHGIAADGRVLFRIPLPARGHAAAAHPTRPEAVAFARRPGTYALVIDCATGTLRARLTPPEGRQFNGHGAFSQDGTVLWTSEVVAETSEGRIGVWDARSYRRMGEFASGGIGPHEIRRIPGTDTLVVANGGIRTDPQDRSKLNLDTMRPNLAYLADGTVQELVDIPDFPQLSIRHLALRDGAVAFAMQWEGDPAEPVPLLGIHRRGQAPQMCWPNEADMFAMRGYAGSIAWADDGRIGLTSPPGGVVMIHGPDGTPMERHPRPDASGIAPAPGGFAITDGGGSICLLGRTLSPLGREDVAWDNHLVAIASTIA